MATAAKTAERVEDVAHSTLGASSAARWMACPGSVKLAEKAGPEAHKSGYAAAEGSAAHKVLEDCLNNRSEPWEFIGRVYKIDDFEITVDQDMTDAVQRALDYIMDTLDPKMLPHLKAERQMSSITHEKAFGTADITATANCMDLPIHIMDYKHGAGIPVEPDSAQTKYYGYLFVEHLDLYGDADVQLHILQPRIPHPKGCFRTYHTTPDELREWWNTQVLPAMAATEDENAILQTGDHCRFCPAKLLCPALKEEYESIEVDSRPEGLSTEEIGDILKRGERVKKWLSELAEEGFRRAIKGEKVPNYKVVRKTSTRVWKDGAEEKIVDKYDQEAYVKKLRSPPQLEKLPGGRKFVAEWAYKPDTGVTLAPESDTREEITSPLDQYLDEEVL